MLNPDGRRHLFDAMTLIKMLAGDGACKARYPLKLLGLFYLLFAQIQRFQEQFLLSALLQNKTVISLTLRNRLFLKIALAYTRSK